MHRISLNSLIPISHVGFIRILLADIKKTEYPLNEVSRCYYSGQLLPFTTWKLLLQVALIS